MKKRVITRIHRLSGGVPRLINTICDRSLLAAYAANKDSVDRRIVVRAASEVMGGARSYFSRTTGVLTAILILVVALAAGWKYLLPKLLPIWERLQEIASRMATIKARLGCLEMLHSG